MAPRRKTAARAVAEKIVEQMAPVLSLDEAMLEEEILQQEKARAEEEARIAADQRIAQQLLDVVPLVQRARKAFDPIPPDLAFATDRIAQLPPGTLDIIEVIAGLNIVPEDLPILFGLAQKPVEQRAIIREIAALDPPSRGAVCGFLSKA